MCSEPTIVASAEASVSTRPGLEPGTATDRVLELGAVRLDAEAPTDSGADGTTHQDVVGEEQIGGGSARTTAAFAST